MSTIKIFGIETFIQKHEIIALISCYFTFVLLRIMNLYPLKVNNYYIDESLRLLIPMILYIYLKNIFKRIL